MENVDMDTMCTTRLISLLGFKLRTVLDPNPDTRFNQFNEVHLRCQNLEESLLDSKVRRCVRGD